jgi:hypothetical protein
MKDISDMFSEFTFYIHHFTANSGILSLFKTWGHMQAFLQIRGQPGYK